MAISLQKGQKVDLTKGNAGLAKIMVGLGWDEVRKPSGGFLSGLFGGSSNSDNSASIDCDASAILLNANNKLVKKEDVVFYGNLNHFSGSVSHMGDNLTGAGDGDDEQISVEIGRIPSDIHHIVFVVSIYDCIKRKQDFGLIQNAFIRVVNTSNGQEILKYDLSDNYAGKTALIVGEVYRYEGEWKFAAIGEGTNDGSLSEIIRRYK